MVNLFSNVSNTPIINSYQPISNDYNTQMMQQSFEYDSSNEATDYTEYNYNQFSDTSIPSFKQKKRRSLNMYEIALFTCYNPKKAILEFRLDAKNGDLSAYIAPAIPNNSAIGIRGPVPSGIKVYDHDKRIVSSFGVNDIISFEEFLSGHYSSNNLNSVLTNINTTLKNINSQSNMSNEQIQWSLNMLSKISGDLDELKNENSTNTQFGIFRKLNNGSTNKGWQFNYDNNSKMLHVNATMTTPNTGEIKANISLSKDMATKLTRVISSYTDNYVLIQHNALFAKELSKTLAFNNFSAPDTKDMSLL